MVTDADPVLQVAGAVGLRAFLSSANTNAPVIFRFDALQVTQLNSTTANVSVLHASDDRRLTPRSTKEHG
jgi:hypothetical protein